MTRRPTHTGRTAFFGFRDPGQYNISIPGVFRIVTPILTYANRTYVVRPASARNQLFSNPASSQQRHPRALGQSRPRPSSVLLLPTSPRQRLVRLPSLSGGPDSLPAVQDSRGPRRERASVRTECDVLYSDLCEWSTEEEMKSIDNESSSLPMRSDWPGSLDKLLATSCPVQELFRCQAHALVLPIIP